MPLGRITPNPKSKVKPLVSSPSSADPSSPPAAASAPRNHKGANTRKKIASSSNDAKPPKQGKPEEKSSSSKPKKKKKKKSKSKSKSNALNSEEDKKPTEPVRKLHKPEGQVTLTEEERKEEIQQVLTGDDPNVPRNACKYSYKDQCFKPDPPGQGDHMAVHFIDEGSSLHVESKEYRIQKDQEELKAEARRTRNMADSGGSKTGSGQGDDGKDSGASDSDGKEDQDGIGETKTSTDTTTTTTIVDDGKNQFNYSERATQTFNNPTRSREVNTEPPPVMQYSANVSQWQIYDAYVNDALVGRMGSSSSGSSSAGDGDKDDKNSFEDRLSVILDDKSGDDDGGDIGGSNNASGNGGDQPSPADAMHGEGMARLLKMTERCMNHNSQDDIFEDFKYWEDASDAHRQNEGTLLPLWKFCTDQTKRKQGTSVCWNPRYPDLFAVGYGSFDFSKQSTGLICLFTLKNTSFPEYTFRTEAGVMCLDFHPTYPSLLAVGCYDGSVMVFDLANKRSTKPIYSSSVRTGRHTDPVWQIHWQIEEDYGKDCTFYSVSSDGRVAKWNMSKNELKMEPVMTLKLVTNDMTNNGAGGDRNNDEGQDDDEDADLLMAGLHYTLPDEVLAGSSALSGLASGSCFDFNPKQDHLFIVGTEEGGVYKCSKAYSGQYLETYVGHHMAVYAARWNPFHERLFLTCSADWTVKLWDHEQSRPILSFDLGNAVGDVCWAPYSSTVFAAITNDGKVHVFDLAENKHESLCSQLITKKASLSSIKFNSKDPILIVADDRGIAHSIKPSPNLRKSRAPPEGKDVDDMEWQRARLETLLSTRRRNS